MEKRKPAYDLKAFELACSDVAGLNATISAVSDAFALGFGRAEIVETIYEDAAQAFL